MASEAITGEISVRMNAAIDLAVALGDVDDVGALLPADRGRLESEVRNAVHCLICPPLLPSSVFACYQDSAPTPELVAELRKRTDALEHENHVLRSQVSGQVVPLHQQRAEQALREAPM